MSTTAVHHVENVAATLAVPISFTLNVDPEAWAGPDSDTMTTAEVADEVQRWVERHIRGRAHEEGFIDEAEANVGQTD